MDFKESTGGTGTLLDKKTVGIHKRHTIRKIPCIPFKSVMLALKQTKVDFFSLDVEGFELEILRTIPWKEVDVSTLAVEYVHGKNGKEAYRKYMDEQDYTVSKDIHDHNPAQTIFVDDFIFAKRGL